SGCSYYVHASTDRDISRTACSDVGKYLPDVPLADIPQKVLHCPEKNYSQRPAHDLDESSVVGSRMQTNIRAANQQREWDDALQWDENCVFQFEVHSAGSVLISSPEPS